MKLSVDVGPDAIQRETPLLSPAACCGALAEFCGIVRDSENGREITALDYEAYQPMAEQEIRRIIHELAESYPCHKVAVVHRIGRIAVGEIAIRIVIAAGRRREAFGMLQTFMDRLKEDVPIWKTGASYSEKP